METRSESKHFQYPSIPSQSESRDSSSKGEVKDPVVDVNHVVTQLLIHLATAAQSSQSSQHPKQVLGKVDSKEKGLKYQRIFQEGSSIHSSPASPKSVNSKRERTVRTCSAESNTSNSNNNSNSSNNTPNNASTNNLGFEISVRVLQCKQDQV